MNRLCPSPHVHLCTIKLTVVYLPDLFYSYLLVVDYFVETVMNPSFEFYLFFLYLGFLSHIAVIVVSLH